MKALPVLVFFLGWAGFPGAGAPPAAPPPPRLAGNGQSLAATMRLIQHDLSALGKVSFRMHVHDYEDGTDSADQYSTEFSKVAADARSCTIKYHRRRVLHGSVLDDDLTFSLRGVQSLTVWPWKQYAAEQHEKDKGDPDEKPTWSAQFDPPMFLVVAHRAGDREGGFEFADKRTANRVATALTHAIQLCGYNAGVR
jgi:hypothetical protein